MDGVSLRFPRDVVGAISLISEAAQGEKRLLWLKRTIKQGSSALSTVMFGHDHCRLCNLCSTLCVLVWRKIGTQPCCKGQGPPMDTVPVAQISVNLCYSTNPLSKLPWMSHNVSKEGIKTSFPAVKLLFGGCYYFLSRFTKPWSYRQNNCFAETGQEHHLQGLDKPWMPACSRTRQQTTGREKQNG